LGADGWTADLELTFTLTLERAEAAYLKGDAPLAAQICDELLARNLDALKQVRVLEMIILLHTSQLAYRDALNAGIQALALLQESLPISPGPVKLLSELARCRFALRRHDQESLLALPAMTDPMRLAIVRVLGLMAAPAYFTETYLLPLIGFRIVHHSIKAGNSVHSPYGYAIYGMLHCAVLGRPKQGLVYGDLAIRCVEKYNAAEIEGRVLMLYAGFIQHWTKPLAETLPVFMEGARKAIAAGDLEYHGYTRYGHASYALMAGQSLPNVAQLLEGHQAAVTTHTHEKTHRIMQMAKASIARMRGLPADQVPDFDEDASFALWTKQQDATSLAYLHKYRMLEAVQRGDTDGVLSAAKGMRANMNGILSMAYQPFFQFYEALAIAEKGRRFAGPGRLGHIARVAILLRRLCHWSDDAPVTLDHRVHLVKAELHALRGQVVKAIARFEKAIDVARRAGALHDVGVCLERTGLFYHWLGTREAAERYLSEAVRAYRNWGADAWAEALQARHPELIRPEEETVEPASVDASIGSSSSGTGQIVDSSTLIRAAAALARKTSLPEVIDEVMRAMVVNAGARRGLLLLKDGDELTAVAEALHDGAVRTMQTPASAYADMPGGLINYVRHAAQTVVLDSARLDPNFGEDPYFQDIPTASVMCVPIMAMGELTAIVYLENSRLRGAFTPARRRTISVLGAQAAVSVENARLIDDLRSSLERQVELTSAHARFVPHSFLEKMERPSIADVRLGDHVQSEASILFSDIRGFTGLIESMAPEEAIAFINAYLSRMEPAVQRGSGFVDSYVGDAVMAVFDLGADVAVTAGLEMNRTLKDWADSGNLPSDAPIRIGIGIASGPIMFGTIGGANRLKCGVIGDAVNLASRIEGLTKRYKATMLINQTTFEQLSSPERHQIRKIDTVRVSGRSAEVNLYEVFDDDPLPLREQKRRSAPEITSGLSQLQSGAVGPAF
ncbi:MAG: adenylate/guanylate cyclase domain-containing protein, partial [Pseudomonadota bacterium]